MKGQHALLGASKYHWLNYNEDTLVERYFQQHAVEVGTAMHNLAHDLITNHIKINKNDKHLINLELSRCGISGQFYNTNDILDTLVPFVNDAIGFRMQSEQVLYYSDICFGTADAISFSNNLLRIHDYKSGKIPAHMEQLEIYAALFCLEYKINPNDIDIELRIYQSGEIMYYKPEPIEIGDTINKIIEANKIINSVRNGGR